MTNSAIKEFSLSEMQALHKQHGNGLLFSYFMDEYCHRLLEDTPGLKKVQVIVSDTFKYEYRKQTLEIVK